MVELHNESKQDPEEVAGPIKPGTALYDALLMVAKRVAIRLRSEARAKKNAVRD